jgi:hypothetical protein
MYGSIVARRLLCSICCLLTANYSLEHSLLPPARAPTPGRGGAEHWAHRHAPLRISFSRVVGRGARGWGLPGGYGELPGEDGGNHWAEMLRLTTHSGIMAYGLYAA